MKLLLQIILLVLPIFCLAQTKNSISNTPGKQNATVSFITKLDIAHATKDGIYLNGYVVNMSYDKMKLLHGKTIQVTGRVTIVKGIKKRDGDAEVQGRQEDMKQILTPRIKIIKP